MQIVAVSYCYPPLRYPRAIQVARLLAHLPDMDIAVVCAIEPGPSDTSLLNAYPDGARRVVRVPWTRSALVRLRLRDRLLEDRLLLPDRYRGWQRAAASRLRSLDRQTAFDVLVTFGQPMSDHLLGLRLAQRRGRRWIAHFSDPWIDSPFFRGREVTRRLNARLERLVVERADALVFTSGETVDLVMGKYPPRLRGKAHVLPHAYDPTLYPDKAPPRDRIIVRYLGNFYGHRSPEPLMHALRILGKTRPTTLEGVRIELIGSSERPFAMDAFSGLLRDTVSIREPVDYLESLALMQTSHLLLLIDAPDESSVFLPSKLVDYLGARRPIVALSPNGAAANLTRRMGGWTADPKNPEAAATALGAAIEAVRRGPVEDWGPEQVVREYEIGTVAPQFRELIDRPS